MIKLSDYDRLYRHNFEWVSRRLEPDCLELYKDTEQGWIEALLVFNKVQDELFKQYSVGYKSGDEYKRKHIKGIEINKDQLFELFHKYINTCTNYTARQFIFHWWNDLRYFVEGAQPTLDCPWTNYKPATKEEIDQARINFGSVKDKDLYTNEVYHHSHTFKDNAVVLEYRGNRFIVDNEWGHAWTKDKNGNVRHFELAWDWWLPIDEYLDLENY